VARFSVHPQAQPQVEDGFLIALAKQGNADAYDRIVRRYYGFVRLKASSYFLAGGDADDLIQEGLVGLYKAVRDYRTDRESSFRNFAELCITRQIITAVKTATRNKHTPLNQYVSFSSTPSGSGGDSDPTLDEILPGSTVHDPVNQVISSEELRALVACISTALSELESRVLALYLDGHSY
jgi:RNA polymerase sporulation-specific sigma factor